MSQLSFETEWSTTGPGCYFPELRTT